ncbi:MULTISPECIES: sensor histidine kinase [Streptomyces]|uniref:sensor histidine kinase n=1 Tax=Streptomyces TaxID=1883 RepID=UPI000D51718F|nr:MULTISPECIES: sensor histidine kinase [Streptomyces]PVC64187.1 two-component sensor histidine kinase [Streptomyces sp. CS065A]
MSTSPAGPQPPADGLLSAARRNLRELALGLSHASHPSTPLLAHAPRLWQRLLPYVVVLALVGTFIPVTITNLITQYGVPGALAGALGVAQAAPLVMLAHRPLQAWWIIFPADVLGALVLLARPADPHDVWPWTPPAIVAYLFLLLALGLRETRRTVIGVWAVTGAAGAVLHLIAPDRSGGSTLLLTILGGVVLVIGGAVRERGVAQRRLAEQETISEAERAQRTLLEERTRIARELHDVVAHHMSVITVQADSAPYRISGLPKAAEEEFTAIATAARESLGEMRRLLSVLRSEGTEGDRAPQPGLDRLQQLVEATVRAGLPAELALSSELSSGRCEVPPAVDLSAYRIVQEALANVVRHAPGAHTRVLVAPDNGHLLVLVVNGPAATRGSPLETSGTGHGLIGMRERVRLTGGTLDTGPLPDGGFRVAARMPLPPATAPTTSPSAAPPAPLPPEDL